MYKSRITNGQMMKPGKKEECFSTAGAVVSGYSSMVSNSIPLTALQQVQAMLKAAGLNNHRSADRLEPEEETRYGPGNLSSLTKYSVAFSFL
jgi:hypothetical protein